MIKYSAMIFFIMMSLFLSLISMMANDHSFLLSINFTFMEYNSAQYSINITCDWKSLSLSSIVCLITSNIMLYSKTYMKSDKFKVRFIVILSMFALSMLLTIMTKMNIIIMLIGWDFLGLTSLLLIMHYQSKYVYSNSMVTFVLNRIGDIAFIIAGGYMFSSGSWSWLCSMDNKHMIIFIMAIAAFTKSAQLPFSSWLPKAMAAPTPVSALVHSSTLVTAGVILLMSTEPLIFNMNYKVLFLYISMFTMLSSSIAGCLSFDLKKIIAFSTMSQISFMMMVLIMGKMELAFLHLLIHALFKSLMFLGAGTIIHSAGGEQDIRKISNLKTILPLESFMIILSALSLMGFPFLSGFYSKDLIIEYYSNNMYSFIMSMIIDISICLTSVYSMRIIKYLVINKNSKNIFMMWSTTNYEKSIMYLFFLPIIIAGSVISWTYISIWKIDFPMSTLKKSFGFWSLITVTIFMFFSYNMYSPVWDFFRSINYMNYFLTFNLYMSLWISHFNNFYENMWNKFLSIMFIMNMKNMLITKKKFNPWMMMEMMMIMLIIIMMSNST